MSHNSSPEKERFAGSVSVLMAALLWGTTGTAAAFAPQLGPLAVGAAAMGGGGLLLALLGRRGILKNWRKLSTHIGLLGAGGVAVAVYPLAFYASMRFAGVTVGTVVSIGLAPVLAGLIEFVGEGKKLGLRWGASVVLGGSGILLLSLGASSHGSLQNSSQYPSFGIALGVLAAFAYAFYSWAASRLMREDGLSSGPIMGAMFGLGSLLLLPVLLISGGAFLHSWLNVGVGLYMALVPMFLGYVLFGYGLARINASTATTLTLVEPAVAALLGVVVLHEGLGRMGWVGVAMIGMCLVIATLPSRQRV